MKTAIASLLLASAAQAQQFGSSGSKRALARDRAIDRMWE